MVLEGDLRWSFEGGSTWGFDVVFMRHGTSHITRVNGKSCIDAVFMGYGVATISRLLKIIGLFCKKAL